MRSQRQFSWQSHYALIVVNHSQGQSEESFHLRGEGGGGRACAACAPSDNSSGVWAGYRYMGVMYKYILSAVTFSCSDQLPRKIFMIHESWVIIWGR